MPRERFRAPTTRVAPSAFERLATSRSVAGGSSQPNRRRALSASRRSMPDKPQGSAGNQGGGQGQQGNSQ